MPSASTLCRLRTPALTMFLAASLAGAAWSAEFSVRSAADLSVAVGKLAPGDVVVMENGVWRDQVLEFAAEGTQAKPIVLRARTPGGTRLEGRSRLEISGHWLQVEGLRFEGGALEEGQAVVQFRGRRGDASNSRFTESAIVRYNPPSPATKYAWVALYGQQNRVDHNRFEGQKHAGVTVVVFRKRGGRVDQHQIDNNYFLDRPPGEGNGFETIRIGTSEAAESDSATRVERNLFERTDGEVETISIKSGANVVRENTFREVAGTVTLRRGDGNVVEENYFLGGHRPGTGGIRVTGARQVVRANHLQELEGRVGGAISLNCAAPQKGTADYPAVQQLELSGNVIADTEGAAIKLDAGCGGARTIRPKGVTVSGNLVGGAETSLADGEAGSGWTWRGNQFDGKASRSAAPADGVARTSGLLERGSDGLWHSRARAVGAGPTKPPLTPRDVGPAWMR